MWIKVIRIPKDIEQGSLVTAVREINQVGQRKLYIAERLDKSCNFGENGFFYKGRSHHGIPKKFVLACVLSVLVSDLQKRVSNKVTVMIGSDELMKMRSNCEELKKKKKPYVTK